MLHQKSNKGSKPPKPKKEKTPKAVKPKKEKVRKAPAAPKPRKPKIAYKSDIYTVMLVITFFALVVACILLYLDTAYMATHS